MCLEGARVKGQGEACSKERKEGKKIEKKGEKTKKNIKREKYISEENFELQKKN